MLTDTHAHLDFPDYAADLDDVLLRAESGGVRRIITIGTSVESSRRAVALAERHPNVYAAIGVHPNAALDAGPDFIEALHSLASSPRVVAIGEIGLDYHRQPGDGALKNAQAAVFRTQLDLALQLGLNVIIHERDAWDDTLNILTPYHGKLRAVFHCFGKGIDQARQLISHGHLVSFTGIITFKNAATAHESAAEVPDGSFMVETDAPFLAPAPFRGKRCEPAYTRLVAEHLAKLRQTSIDDIAAQTESTANQFFAFRPEDRRQIT